jgi:hypothetical protein
LIRITESSRKEGGGEGREGGERAIVGIWEKWGERGRAVDNGRKGRSSLSQVFNFRRGRFAAEQAVHGLYARAYLELKTRAGCCPVGCGV